MRPAPYGGTPKTGNRPRRYLYRCTASAHLTISAAQTDEHVWGGISEKGRIFILEMNRLGIIVDPSHATEAAHLQAAEASLAPIADSHASYRRRPDEQGLSLPSTAQVIKAIAAKGGMFALIQSAVDSKPLEEWRNRNAPRQDAGARLLASEVESP